MMGFLCGTASSIWVGTVLLPHGDFAYDPTILSASKKKSTAAERSAAHDVAHQAHTLAQYFQSAYQPDLILLSSPHSRYPKDDNKNTTTSQSYGLYTGSLGHGSATIGQDLRTSTSPSRKNNPDRRRFRRKKHHPTVVPYNISLAVDLAPQPSKRLLDHLHSRHVNVTGITGRGRTMMPLDWGEVIPLALLHPGLVHKKQPLHSNRLDDKKHQPHMIWTYPHQRRIDHAPEMVDELLGIGTWIMEWIQSIDMRVGIVISGDLAHTHRADGPYGYSVNASKYDSAIGDWADDPCDNEERLLRDAAKYQPTAKSCGFTGFVLWHAMLCSAVPVYEAHVHVNRNVTYYGMMVANYSPVWSTPTTTS